MIMIMITITRTNQHLRLRFNVLYLYILCRSLKPSVVTPLFVNISVVNAFLLLPYIMPPNNMTPLGEAQLSCKYLPYFRVCVWCHSPSSSLRVTQVFPTYFFRLYSSQVSPSHHPAHTTSPFCVWDVLHSGSLGRVQILFPSVPTSSTVPQSLPPPVTITAMERKNTYI